MLIRRVPGAVGVRPARQFVAASSQYLRVDSGFGIGPTDPFWMAMLVDTGSLSSSGMFLGATTGTNQSRGGDIYSGTTAAAFSNAGSYVGGAANSWSTADRWTLFVVEFGSPSSRAVYILPSFTLTERVASATSTSTLTTAPTLAVFGAYPGLSQYHNGPMARAMVGYGLTNAAMRRAFANGVHPASSPWASRVADVWDLTNAGAVRGAIQGTLLRPVNGGALTPGPSWLQGPNRVYRMPIGEVLGGAPTSYTLTADAGAAAITGTTATTLYQRVVQAASDTVTATGTTANALYNRVVAALSTAWALTGQTAGAFYQRVVSALSSAVDVTTTTATTLWHRVTGAQTASVDVTGTTATLTYSGDTGPTAEQRKKQFLLMGVMKALLLALWSDHV